MLQFHTKYKRPATRLRVVDKKSVTVPDQTLSLKTMVTKYARGLPISAPRLNGMFTDDELAVDFDKLDLAEQEERIYSVSDELSTLKSNIAKQEQEKAAEAAKKAEETQKELEELRKKVASQVQKD